MNSAPETQRNWKREPMVWMLIAIPLAAVIMGVVMITLASQTFSGLVVDDYYKKGKQINRVLARDRLAQMARVVRDGRGLQEYPSLNNDQLAAAERGIVVANVTPTGSEIEYKVVARVLELPVEALYITIADIGKQVRWVPDLAYSTCSRPRRMVWSRSCIKVSARRGALTNG